MLIQYCDSLSTEIKYMYSRTSLFRPPSTSDWIGRKTGVVVHEGLDYFIAYIWTPAHAYLSILSVSSTLRPSFGVHVAERGKRSYLSAIYSIFRRRPRSPCLTQNSIGLRWPRFPTTMLSFSYINLPNISISGLIKPHSENIVQILVATFTLLALLPHSFYFHYILRDRLNLRLADPQVDDFLFSIYLSFGCSQFKNFRARLPRQPMWWITYARDTHYLRVRLSTATYWSYVKRAALYRTFISQSFVRGNNSNDPVAGHVSEWSLTRVDTQCVYHPLHEMWS